MRHFYRTFNSPKQLNVCIWRVWNTGHSMSHWVCAQCEDRSTEFPLKVVPQYCNPERRGGKTLVKINRKYYDYNILWCYHKRDRIRKVPQTDVCFGIYDFQFGESNKLHLKNILLCCKHIHDIWNDIFECNVQYFLTFVVSPVII